ncbi:MAG: lysophospholipid acyltransferase family protein [Trichloromonadaceae bacterium]
MSYAETPLSPLDARSLGSFAPRFKGPLRLAIQMLERASGLHGCRSLYAGLAGHIRPGGDFVDQALSLLGVQTTVTTADLERIPASGPLVVVANHPFGAIEGLLLAGLLRRRRADVKILANHLLQSLPELGELLIPVDPFGGKNSARRNVRPMREGLRWLKQGGVLLVFPAGEVSHLQLFRREVSDPLWSINLARIVRGSGAPVLPIFVPGQNGPLFQMAGLIHPRLRTLLLPRELLNKQNRTLPLRIGNLISAARLGGFPNNRQLVEYLRLRTYLLGAAEGKKPEPATAPVSPISATSVSPGAELLAGEIAALPREQLLVESGAFQVWQADAGQIPQLLWEIGRLRELTFRLCGEGTGKEIDLDRFDQHYLHLFVWNREQQEIVGAYRCGRTDQILRRFGVEGLYTSTLFKYRRELLDQIGPALEMGRSFVRPEYQKSYAPLLLLWKGIGHFVVRHPQYRTLFGPVSISRDYSDLSRQLIAGSLQQSMLISELSRQVQPRVPLPLRPLKLKGCDRQLTRTILGDIDEVSMLVGDLELEQKGIPVLLRHYLNLGGRFLAFNRDPKFSDALDGLVLVDLTQTERKTLDRYMTRSGAGAFLDQNLG